jgi:Flp pilus assembly protein TadD
MTRQEKPGIVRRMTPKGMHELGLRLYSEGRMEEALAQFWAALKAKETSERWNDWAAAQHALGFILQAESGFRKAFEMDKSNLQAAANLGSLLVAHGRPIEAAPFLLAALKTPDEELRTGVKYVISQISKLNGAANAPAVPPKPRREAAPSTSRRVQ